MAIMHRSSSSFRAAFTQPCPASWPELVRAGCSLAAGLEAAAARELLAGLGDSPHRAATWSNNSETACISSMSLWPCKQSMHGRR